MVLYGLLTGHRPYHLLSAARQEMSRVISQVEPTRPSAVIATTETTGSNGEAITPATVSQLREGDPARLRKRLEGDLDCVVLTALQKEPERRYGSVESFADDLRRHLEHRPVAAREATAWYRTMRFCRRNPGGVAAALLLATVFLAATAAVVWQTRLNLELSRASFAPMWVYFGGVALAGLGLAVYFTHPPKPKLLGAFAGGAVWTACIIGKYWLSFSRGWWHSALPATPDPLLIFSPWFAFTVDITATALLLLIALVGRRFGWKGEAVFLLMIGLGGEFRERLWWSVILPTLIYDSSWIVFLVVSAITIAGGAIGLLLMRLIAGPDLARRRGALPDSINTRELFGQ